jgi:hypothetical protein
VGYTHYFSQKTDCPQAQWQAIVDRTRQLLSFLEANQCPVSLGNWAGKPGSKPLLNESFIKLNGVQPFVCETFALSRIKNTDNAIMTGKNNEYAFDCCKTRQMPYDLVVCLILLIANSVAPDVWLIESDGVYADWQPAIMLYTRVFNALPVLPAGIKPAVSQFAR